MIAPGSSRNSRPSAMPSVRSQSTANGSKPKPRINNQQSRNWNASESSCVTTKIVPIAEHSRNSRNFSDSKHFVPSHKAIKRYKPVEQISVAKKPERQILTGHRFSIKKTSVVHKKTKTPRSCLRWKPTGRIFKTVGLRWFHTGKIVTSSTTKVDSEPPHGSNAYITNPYECKQTLDLSAGTSINVQKEQTLNLGALIPIDKDKIKALIKENMIAERPSSYGITLKKAKEISARPQFQRI
ncbi:hypothetical protein Tco_1168809 [Tanacetum coccineum]